MSAQEKISKLQGLLERIQRNASRSHTSAPVTRAPLAFAAPAAVQAAPAPFVAAPAPFVAPPPAPSKFDQSVDDLLGAAPDPSPLPVDVDVSLDSVPPGAELSPSQQPDADPIPLVSPSTGQAAPAPPPLDDAFALESEVSEVRAALSSRDPAPEVTVDAIAAEAEAIAAEELSEDDLVEVTEGSLPPPSSDVDFADEEAQPPASSQRSRVASTMDEALAAAAADQLEREVPLKTPPPESGPQEAPVPTGMASPAAPDVDALLSGELDIPTRAHAGVTLPSGPTPEQLGQTIDLEEARGPTLELAEQKGHELPTVAAIEDLEAAVPGPSVLGGYDDSLAPPPEAREDLEAHRRRLEDDIPPPPQSLAQFPSVQPGAAATAFIPSYNAGAGPEVMARPVPMGTPESFGTVRASFRPSSFVELLDASLALNGE